MRPEGLINQAPTLVVFEKGWGNEKFDRVNSD